MSVGPHRRFPGLPRLGPWLAAALAAVLLAGCSTVPTSGPIQQGPVVDAAESTQFIRVIAAPPSTGASPTEVVQGFLEANVSLEDDHGIARRYLTEGASSTWDPGAGTTVIDASTLVLSARGDQVQMQVAVTGRLRPDGSVEVVTPAEPLRYTFTLAEVADEAAGETAPPEWRIADPPPGVLISATDLRRAYRLYEAYFPSARSPALVPDGRLVPVVGPSLATTLAELVLAGPSEWLAPAVRPIAPAGTSLALGAVPVRDGVADVALTDQVLSATESERRDLAAQLTWTLTQLPDVVSVELTAAGEPLQIPDAPLQMTRSAWLSRSPDVLSTGASGGQVPPSYALSEDAIVRVTDVSRTRVPLPPEAPDGLTGLAVSLDQRRAAAVERDRRALWLLPLDRSSSARRIELGTISDASFDVDGRVWVAVNGGVRRIGPSGQVEPVKVEDRTIGPITALQLARDGARVAVVAGRSVHVGALVETESGAVIASLHRVETAVETADGVAWRNASTLDALGAPPDGGLQVLRITLGDGQVLSLGSPAQPRAVAAAPGGLTLVLVRSGGVFANVGLQWRDYGEGDSIAYPG